MMNWFCRLGAALAALMLMGMAGQAEAASEERTFNACAEAIKKEFGASPVEFDKFRRKRGGRRNYAFGELTMSDGSKAQIRCRYKSGRVQGLQFRGTNEPGNMWIDKRPEAAIYVEPKKDDENGGKKAADTENTDTENTDTENTDTENTDTENTDTADKKDDEPVRPKRESVTKDADPEKPDAEKTAGTGKDDTADKKDKTEGDAKAEAPVKPRFIKAPTN